MVDKSAGRGCLLQPDHSVLGLRPFVNGGIDRRMHPKAWKKSLIGRRWMNERSWQGGWVSCVRRLLAQVWGEVWWCWWWWCWRWRWWCGGNIGREARHPRLPRRPIDPGGSKASELPTKVCEARRGGSNSNSTHYQQNPDFRQQLSLATPSLNLLFCCCFSPCSCFPS